ncbi:hypothetical protein AVEN_193034-1 [Araneus ventricosus]|uniref:Uncharacterized protein n=1 Tax=Araneus ventricosus TaxID=182803 RepID=A0A4Y2QBW1_ARAVE|nr:hypothetical protein AVEN_193034-1 [Araneus ventricosus]
MYSEWWSSIEVDGGRSDLVSESQTWKRRSVGLTPKPKEDCHTSGSGGLLKHHGSNVIPAVRCGSYVMD